MVVLKKLKSNTLVEVLVSTVIISVLMSIAIMTILNLSKDVYLSSVNKDLNKLNEGFYLELNKNNKIVKRESDPELLYKMLNGYFELSIETKKEEVIVRNGVQK